MAIKVEEPKWMKTEDYLVVVFPGKSPKSFKSKSEEASALIKMLAGKNYRKAWNFMFPEDRLRERTKNKISMDGNGVLRCVTPAAEVLDPIVKTYLDRIPQTSRGYESLVNLSANVRKAKNKWVRDQLVRFLRSNNLPITQDGCFLAYKYVDMNEDKSLVDKKTRSIPNNVRDRPKLSAKDVDYNPNISCAPGLHVASWEYAQSMGGGNSVLILCKVNPKDVVSVPYDYDNQKLRCLEYLVLARDIVEPYRGRIVDWFWDVSELKVTGVSTPRPKPVKPKSRLPKGCLRVPILLNSLTVTEVVSLVENACSLVWTGGYRAKVEVLQESVKVLKKCGIRVKEMSFPNYSANGKNLITKRFLAYIPIDKVPLDTFGMHRLGHMSGRQLVEYIHKLTGEAIPVSTKSKVNIRKHAIKILDNARIRYSFMGMNLHSE